MQTDLSRLLGEAYAAKVMHRGNYAGVINRLVNAFSDVSVLAEARAEYGRTKNIDARRCFASSITASALRDAISAFEAAPSIASQALQAIPVLPTVNVPSTGMNQPNSGTSTKDEDMTSKLKGLADLAKSTIADVEGRATSAMDKLNKAQAHAHGGLDKIDTVTAEIEQAATDMENFANQVTNGPPS